jgi:hypothetical protein
MKVQKFGSAKAKERASTLVNVGGSDVFPLCSPALSRSPPTCLLIRSGGGKVPENLRPRVRAERGFVAR